MKPLLSPILHSLNQGHLLGKNKVCTPQMSCILCKKEKKREKKRNKQTKTKKSASDFSTRQRSTPLLPMQLQEGSLNYTYINVLVGGPADQRKSLHVLVLVTNFYIVNVG
uniref:Uncharacterized protein n=1 Tax=Urocitellus parryii TaxID=9999 RepID=A0A8D2HIG5_UROPR